MNFLMSYRFPFLCAAIFGLTGVVLGAVGAHGSLRQRLDALGTHGNWETAVQYQLIHAVVLLFVALWWKLNAGDKNRRTAQAAGLLVLGVGFFSGSIYVLALGGPRWLGPVTPVGGLLLVGGWGLLLLEAIFGPKPART
jgi:uncharacterized membrane protein YgdD (TMEM256/DUF423 family)